LQYLREDADSWRTGTRKCEAVSGEEVEVESEPEEEQGRTRDTGEISRIQFLETEGRSVHPNSEPDEGTFCGEDTPPDEANALRRDGRTHPSNQSISDWLDGILPIGKNAECVPGTGRMDKTETETDAVETLEERDDALP